MGKKRINLPPSQQKSDDNVAQVMGKGLYWIGKSVLSIPVIFGKSAVKVVKVITDKEKK
jgi:hypothetical protein